MSRLTIQLNQIAASTAARIIACWSPPNWLSWNGERPPISFEFGLGLLLDGVGRLLD